MHVPLSCLAGGDSCRAASVPRYLYRGVDPNWLWFRLITLVASFLLAIQARPSLASSFASSRTMTHFVSA
jgi:hypothetical protein